MAITEAFLLCGGGSERLGFAKEMLRVDGRPLAAAMVRRLGELFPSVSVVTNRPAYLRHWLEVPLVGDEFPGLGPLAGIHAALRRAAGARVFVLGCDMPLVSGPIIGAVLERAAQGEAPAVVARTPRGPEPLCGVYAVSLADALAERLRSEEGLGARDFLSQTDAQFVDFAGPDAAAFRDVDRPADISLVRQAFEEAEPLPVARRAVTRFGGQPAQEDILVVERPFDFRVNGVHLVTILCMPNAVRELAVGFLAYMGLLDGPEDVQRMDVDYEEGRLAAAISADESRLRSAVRLQISSTCGAGVHGPALPRLAEAGAPQRFRVGADHVLEVLRGLRAMAPVFERTGATHQAAFCDGRRVLHCFEDVGRHNAIDKVVGRALLEGTDLSRGLLAATGRVNAEMVVKALRQRIPVAATRSAVTAHALGLAEAHGLTLVGFARGHRMNVYTGRERIDAG
jgi:FdhD protein